jgi:hypothetical protein
MSRWSKIVEVSPTRNKGAYIVPGQHRLEIQRCRMTESQKNGKTFFVVEAKVTETDSDEYSLGQLVTWLVNMDSYPESALADIKGFVVAASGAEEAQVNAEFMEEVLAGEGDLLHASKVDVFAREVPTKAGGNFTKVYWATAIERGVEPDLPPAIAEA